MSEVSKLRLYSLGLVAANKPLSSKDIQVTPIEDLPMLDGELTDSATDTSSQAKDSDGAAYHTQVATSATVTATWLPWGSGNRLTAPDVRRGERVLLYRYADQDKFYWITQGQDINLRKLETVVWGISATRDESAAAGPDNMYWMQWSSHQKLIHIHTSQADGEPFAYDLQLNTKDGTFLFQDSDGQKFSLDSQARVWRVENRDGTYAELNQRQITQFAPDKITLQSKDIVLNAEHDVTLTAGNNVSVTAGSQILATATKMVVDAFTLVKQALAAMSTMRAGTNDSGAGGISVGQHTHLEQGDFALVSAPIDSSGN